MGFFGFPNLPNAEFPASSDARIYSGLGVSALGAAVPVQNTMSIYPYYVKKTAINPNLVIEQTGSASTTVLVGIYDGSSGLPSAPLLYSGTITTTTTAQIYKDTSNITLSAGYYILCGICTSASPQAFRTMTLTGLSINIFGRPSTDSSIDINYYYTQTGQTSLPSTIGTITRSGTAGQGVSVFLEY